MPVHACVVEVLTASADESKPQKRHRHHHCDRQQQRAVRAALRHLFSSQGREGLVRQVVLPALRVQKHYALPPQLLRQMLQNPEAQQLPHVLTSRGGGGRPCGADLAS